MSAVTLSQVDGPPLERLESLLWIGDIPAIGAVRCPDRPAIIFPDRGRDTRYAQLNRACDAFVALLHEHGLKSGDRAAYLGKNSDLYLPVLFGAIRAGIVIVPLNWRLTAKEIGFQLDDSDSKLLIHDAEFATVAAQARLLCRAPPALLMTESESDAQAVCLRRLLQRDAPAHAAPHDQQQVILQLYTSGTTGRPKGVLVSHFALSLSRHAELTSPGFTHLGEGSVILSAMPNFHVGGMSWVLMGLVRFGTVVLTADASAAPTLALLRKYRADHCFMVPTVLRSLVDELRRTGESAPPMIGIYYGAMAMSESLLRESLNLFSGCGFVHFFGMTEVSGSASFLSPRDHDLSRPQLLKTVGKPYPGVSLQIRGPDRAVLPRHAHGEIWIKSPTLMLGYNKLPDKTAEAVVDGWYASGDGGFLDDEGYLHLTDRIKDMIVSGGENVYPAEVEEALRRHASVLDAAVVAIPDERWGEMVAAAIELRPGMAVSAADLQSFAREQIAGFKCPKSIHFLERLPRTASGKVQRAEVRTQLRDKVR